MSDLSENWIYNLIPEEEYKQAIDLANAKSISDTLNQEEIIDYNKIEHIKDILELALIDILKRDEYSEKNIVEISQKIYLLLAVKPIPMDEIEKAKHSLNILVYSYMGEQWESGRRYLIENKIDIIVSEEDEWNVRLFKKICNALFLLVKKENWNDLTKSCQIISNLRNEQKKFEHEYINTIEPDNMINATYELVSLYHLAKIVDLMACFMTNGEMIDIREQLGLHFEKAIVASETGGNISLNLMLVMLQKMFYKMISNSVWMVTQKVNSRVTKFVRNITKQDKAVFELMYPQKHAILDEGLLDPAHKAVVVNMPTSSGKTLIAQFRILQALNQFSDDNGWVAYIAPTRALVNQVASKLKKEFEPIGIKVEKMSGAIEIDSFENNIISESRERFDVLVVTPEKMNLLIREKIESKMGRPLALAVVDEAHNIEGEGRGVNLEILLANIKNDCPKANFLLLTPFINNGNDIAKWLDTDSPKSISLSINWKPNKRILGAVYPEGERRNWKLYYQTLLTNSSEIQIEKKIVLADVPTINETRSKLTKLKLATAAAELLADRKGILVIGGHVKDCWTIAGALYDDLKIECVDDDVQLVRKYIASEYGDKFQLVKLLEKGIAVHHSGLSDEVRVLIEWLMEKGKLNILVATTTIAQGINFPVSTIIMASTSYPYKSEMPYYDFWNLVGRAGRAGQNDVGVIGIAVGPKNEKQKQVELQKLCSYVGKSTKELVSRLQKISENTIKIGEKFSLTEQFYNTEWSQFLQYITHMFNQCKDLGEFEEKSDLFLRRTLGYSNIEPQKQKLLLTAVKEYGDVLNKNKGLAKMSDSTGFSMESLRSIVYKINTLGVQQDSLKQSSLFKNESQLKDLIGIMMNIPEISESMQDISKGDKKLQGDTIARLTSDWVNGTKLEVLASRYFGNEKDAMTECCQAIYGKLVNSATWGLSTIQKLGLHSEKLSDEESKKVANLPAMIYYGVNSDEAILMRMNNIPRSLASEMGVEYSKAFEDIYKQSSYETHQWIKELTDKKWEECAKSNKGISGCEYKKIWKVLNNEEPD
jgi:replicative superfamily II helicase